MEASPCWKPCGATGKPDRAGGPLQGSTCTCKPGCDGGFLANTGKVEKLFLPALARSRPDSTVCALRAGPTPPAQPSLMQLRRGRGGLLVALRRGHALPLLPLRRRRPPRRPPPQRQPSAPLTRARETSLPRTQPPFDAPRRRADPATIHPPLPSRSPAASAFSGSPPASTRPEPPETFFCRRSM